jgi:hypothetical protein
MTREEAIAYFEETERMCAALSIDWQRGATPAGEGILARLIPQQELEPVLTFDVYADASDIAFVAEAPVRMRFLISLVKSLKRRLQTFEASPERKDYAAECAMKCSERGFQTFLHEVHGLDHPWDSHRAATKIHSILNIHSRRELNENQAAADGWKRLRGEYEAWRKR